MKNLGGYGRVHFIGIGGVSMSALALLLKRKGAEVSGSDITPSPVTARLSEAGIRVFCPHAAENALGADLVVKNSAIKSDNPELVFARQANTKIIERAELLGLVMRDYKQKIAVAGMHGKTTATGLAAAAFAPLKPSVHIGGELIEPPPEGGGEIFISEACEYCRNFLFLRPDIAVVLNIDADHLDYFADTEDIVTAFQEFADNIEEGGTLIYNGDDGSCRRLAHKNKISFGVGEGNDYRAVNISCKKGRYSFDILRRGEFVVRLHLRIFGRHNIFNALAAYTAADICGVDAEEARRGIEGFAGVRRRFELYKKKLSGADVIVDYAHHPKEIAATLAAAQEAGYEKIYCVFQPHTYTRTETLIEGFASCFAAADFLILLPVYAARERAGATDSRTLLARVVSPPAKYIEGGADAIEFLRAVAKENDAVLIVGAGDIADIVRFV